MWREEECGRSPSLPLSLPPFLTPSLSLSPFLRGLPDRIICEQTTCKAPRGVHNMLDLCRREKQYWCLYFAIHGVFPPTFHRCFEVYGDDSLLKMLPSPLFPSLLCSRLHCSRLRCSHFFCSRLLCFCLIHHARRPVTSALHSASRNGVAVTTILVVRGKPEGTRHTSRTSRLSR